jgi:tetratricopeptide (TPR) repeat protein
MSRIEDQIIRRLGDSTSYDDWLSNKSRLAIYLAQKGDIAAAERQVLEIRNGRQTQSNLREVVCANLVEATICFQRGVTSEAIEKARRAYALSKSVTDKGLSSMSAAWLAHFLFNAGIYHEAIVFAAESLVEPTFCEKMVIARASLVVASMYHFFDDYKSAKLWYDSARNAAVAEGDDVMIGLVLYNIATYRLNNIRMLELNGKSSGDDMLRLKLEAMSSSNFDLGVQSSAFPVFLPLLTAQILTLDKKYFEASKIFEKWLCEVASGDMKRLYPPLRADYAWCLANIGLRSSALSEVSRVVADLSFCDAPDDRAMALNRVAMTYSLCGNSEDAFESASRMRTALTDHQVIQSKILTELNLAFGT